MVKLFGGRGAAAIIGVFMLALGSSEAGAQNMANALNVPAVVRTLDVDQAAKPLGTTMPAVARVTPATTVAARSITAALPVSINREAAWLYNAGWPLYALVDKYSSGAPLGQEANCVATAVYFEARGETVEGQLAVAKVIMNRAASGKYPASWCSVVTQPWQFSFVNPHTGQLPAVDTQSAAWARAQGVTRLAIANVVPSLSNDVLWYHANYVAPAWGKRLSLAQRIGAHIFYRS
ncbi:MAG TPA: cell wall hydrolase [Sphingomicrobium sp.]